MVRGTMWGAWYSPHLRGGGCGGDVGSGRMVNGVGIWAGWRTVMVISVGIHWTCDGAWKEGVLL